jgi:hypothetical protein
MQLDPIGTGSMSSISGVTPTTSQSPAPTPFLDGTIGSIAGTLGLSTQQLQSQLASGTSLANIAQQQGVSRSSLVSSIEQTVQQNRQSAGLPPIDQTQLDRAVNRAVDRQHHGHRRSQATSSAQPVQQTPPAAQPGVLGSTLFDQLA